VSGSGVPALVVCWTEPNGRIARDFLHRWVSG
jgi:hypothetical protein